MTPQQLREIADFAFWQHTENECDRGYVRSGNSVMRRALEELQEKETQMLTQDHETWQCPRCGAVNTEYAPFPVNAECSQCGYVDTAVDTTSGDEA